MVIVRESSPQSASKNEDLFFLKPDYFGGMVAWPLMSCFQSVLVREKVFRCWVVVWKKLTSWEGYRGFMTGHQPPSAKYRKGCWLFWFTPVAFLAGVSNIFYFHPYYLGKIPILTHIFQRGWNHQPVLLLVATGKNRMETKETTSVLRSKNSSAQQDVMIQSIPNFVQESAVGNTQRVKNALDFFFVADTVDGSEVRDHHRKDAVYQTCES